MPSPTKSSATRRASPLPTFAHASDRLANVTFTARLRPLRKVQLAMRSCFAAAALALLTAAITAAQAKAEQPADYCRRDDDAPRDLPPEMANEVARLFELSGPEQAAGAAVCRCAGGKALLCYVGANLPCVKIDTSRKNEAVARCCRENPGDTVPAAVSGHDTLFEWRCVGKNAQAGKPVWRRDARGFAAELWKSLP
jgi:hypothetical protein